MLVQLFQLIWLNCMRNENVGGKLVMPKQKTHRGSAKRFKRTGNGGLKRFRAFTSHRFHGKTKKQRRQLRKAGMVSSGDFKRIRQQLARMK